jgi:phosphoenolpyruvate carboxykinase (ATP)
MLARSAAFTFRPGNARVKNLLRLKALTLTGHSARGLSTITADECFGAASPCAAAGIDVLGITKPKVVYKNLSYDELRAHEVKNHEGVVTTHGGTSDTDGCFTVDTGIFTGRSPKDKFIVKAPGTASEKNIWWGSVNQPMKAEVFDELMDDAVAYYNSLDECYVFDGFAGATDAAKRKVRFVHSKAWQQHFVTNMFIRPTAAEANDVSIPPDFTVINACAIHNKKWKEHGLNSDVVVAIDVERKLAVVMGTWYGGENKKLIFSLMNYWLPTEGTLSMHCSASVDNKGENAALFFGLSGTGKTTLSADPNRQLIGDDEHGWHPTDGIFNIEG